MSAAAPSTSFKAAGGNIEVSATAANGAAAGTIYAADLQWNPRLSSVKEIIIPISESWMLTDLYAASAVDAGTDTNPQLEFRKDNDRLLDTSQRLALVIVTSNQRPNGLHGNLLYEGGSHMTSNVITTAAAAAERSIKAIAPYEKSG